MRTLNTNIDSLQNPLKQEEQEEPVERVDQQEKPEESVHQQSNQNTGKIVNDQIVF